MVAAIVIRPDPHIRPATLSDRQTLARLIAQSYADVARRYNLTPENCPKHPSNCTTEWIDSDMQRGVRYFVMEQAGQPLGCVALEIPRPAECYLERLAVLPSYRHQGYGALLVQWILAEARRRDLQQVGVGIIAAQTELRQWYAGQGFVAGETRTFEHLPFEVTFMQYDLEFTGAGATEAIAIQPFQPPYKDQVIDLILSIQVDEFGLPITAEDQPDLSEIPRFYQKGRGNFWVALANKRVVGTIALIDIGDGQGALRKMFVHPAYRGPRWHIAHGLLQTLLAWAREQGMREILLGTTRRYLAAHRFYEKHGFEEIEKASLPAAFPVMAVDTKFYRYDLAASSPLSKGVA